MSHPTFSHWREALRMLGRITVFVIVLGIFVGIAIAIAGPDARPPP